MFKIQSKCKTLFKSLSLRKGSLPPYQNLKFLKRFLSRKLFLNLCKKPNPTTPHQLLRLVVATLFAQASLGPLNEARISHSRHETTHSIICRFFMGPFVLVAYAPRSVVVVSPLGRKILQRVTTPLLLLFLVQQNRRQIECGLPARLDSRCQGEGMAER